MRHHLSRRQSLSLGVFGALGVLATWSCGGDESSPAGGTGGTGGSGTGGGDSGGSAGSGGATGGSGGATGGTGGATGGTGGATGGAGGTGGATGGAGGTGGATGGSGGASGSGGSGGGQDAGNAKDSGTTGDGSNIGCGMAVVALIFQNHATGPHVLSIPPADVTAGTDKVYNARGQSSHDHFVQLTAADFATLKAGGTVIKKSCNSTDHEFVLSCAPPSRQPATPTCTDECGLTMTTLCPS